MKAKTPAKSDQKPEPRRSGLLETPAIDRVRRSLAELSVVLDRKATDEQTAEAINRKHAADLPTLDLSSNEVVQRLALDETRLGIIKLRAEHFAGELDSIRNRLRGENSAAFVEFKGLIRLRARAMAEALLRSKREETPGGITMSKAMESRTGDVIKHAYHSALEEAEPSHMADGRTERDAETLLKYADRVLADIADCAVPISDLPEGGGLPWDVFNRTVGSRTV